ncbi:hypothetical protein ISF_02661 [Cordyceps fumosorosea ARSEF 2679]|uniref:Uncharacterized protein n=1 Tax=Cordyceps fumosorosea (strain ARSEF 2679) TaxID=1081104 RepID=A0A168BXW7_CORFA|nr:hypothetical protein ISF_02661 [Cordyceps fumosorosea ARSEF 2679]OAA70687.1 hypothetical protein ISF_02661 [Cordyceps fumosorosea ARSEF 2679]
MNSAHHHGRDGAGHQRREAAAAAEAAEAETAAQTTSAREQQTAAPLRQARGGILAPPGQQQQQQPPQIKPTRTITAPRTETTRSEELEEPTVELVPRTARPAQVTGLAPPPEPELPPARPDPVTSSPSRGIHNSPSRWRTRAKQKSSPLKQPPMRPDHGDQPSPVPTPHALQRRPNPPAAGAADDEERPRDTARPDPARNVSLLDPDKVKERNALRDELAQLQRDLEMATQENARLLSTQNTGRYTAPGNKDKILDLLRRSLIPADSLAPAPQSQQLMMAALNPIGLLPFSKPVATLVPDTEDGRDIASHHPIEMSAEEELAYLKVFSPFDVTSSVAALPATREHPFRQRRILTLRDRERLFQARVELIVNPMTLAILELRVLSLEPSAASELRSFVDTVCGGGPCNRSMQRNVGMLFWAMAEWRRAAVERAEAWARLDAEVLAKGGPAQAAAAMRRQAEQTSEKVAPPPREAVVLGGSDLRYLMGKQAYDIPIESGGSKRDNAHIRLEWKIFFDWTGEAESKLAVLEGVPGKWRRADRRGSLGKLGGLFQDLVRGSEDIDVAARKIAALLVDAAV